jgi:hypothetical protein
VAFHLDGQLLGVGGAAGDRRLLVAACGEMRLQPRQLLGGRLAVADGLAEDLQALPAGVLGAQPGQPLAGHRRRGADLGRQLDGAKPPASSKLPPQVGVGDPVPHQPRPQLPQARITLPVAAQQPQQVAGEAWRHADLAGQLNLVDRPAGVDLTGQPRVGDPLPGRPRVGRPLGVGLVGGDADSLLVEGHRRPPSRSGHTTRAAAARPCSRSWRRCMRLKARSVLRPRRRSTLSARRAARSSARSRRACSCGA